MFEKKIYIMSDYLRIGKKEILWPMILGIKEYGGENLQRISYGLPRVDLYLEGGKAVTVSNRNLFFFSKNKSTELKKISCPDAIELIKKQAINSSSVRNKHSEWRLILPIAICEILAGGVGLLKNIPIKNLVLTIIIAGILGSVIGFYWERQKRKKLFSLKE